MNKVFLCSSVWTVVNAEVKHIFHTYTGHCIHIYCYVLNKQQITHDYCGHGITTIIATCKNLKETYRRILPEFADQHKTDS